MSLRNVLPEVLFPTDITHVAIVLLSESEERDFQGLRALFVKHRVMALLVLRHLNLAIFLRK